MCREYPPFVWRCCTAVLLLRPRICYRGVIGCERRYFLSKMMYWNAKSRSGSMKFVGRTLSAYCKTELRGNQSSTFGDITISGLLIWFVGRTLSAHFKTELRKPKSSTFGDITNRGLLILTKIAVGGRMDGAFAAGVSRCSTMHRCSRISSACPIFQPLVTNFVGRRVVRLPCSSYVPSSSHGPATWGTVTVSRKRPATSGGKPPPPWTLGHTLSPKAPRPSVCPVRNVECACVCFYYGPPLIQR